MTIPHDVGLIQKAQNGDTVAFERLFQKYDRRVFTIATNYTQNVEDAKDIYQEVFIRAYHGLAKFRFQSEFSTWLHRITVNACLSFIAEHKKHRHTSLDENYEISGGKTKSRMYALQSEEEADQGARTSEVLTYVGQALDTLSPKQRMVFTLRHVEGYKLREIAVMMKCTAGSVKRHLFVATMRMRSKLREFKN